MRPIIGYSKEQQIGKRFTPKMKNRTKITEKEYKNAIKAHGSRCIHCGNPKIEMHHVKYRSQGGKGVWRNLVPLCQKHHIQAHSHPKFADMERNLCITKYGEHYWCDKYDLYRLGLIENPDDEEFENFMKSQEYEEPERVPNIYDDFEFPF